MSGMTSGVSLDTKSLMYGSRRRKSHVKAIRQMTIATAILTA